MRTFCVGSPVKQAQPFSKQTFNSLVTGRTESLFRAGPVNCSFMPPRRKRPVAHQQEPSKASPAATVSTTRVQNAIPAALPGSPCLRARSSPPAQIRLPREISGYQQRHHPGLRPEGTSSAWHGTAGAFWVPARRSSNSLHVGQRAQPVQPFTEC